MSLQGLVSGADCAAPNALASVLKHADADRSLQQDRTAGPSSSRLQRLPQSASAAALIRDRDAALAQQFFTAEPSPRAFPAHAPPPMMLQQRPGVSGAAPLAESWTAAGQLHVTPPPSARWAAEFAPLPLAPEPAGAMAPPSLMPSALSMPAGMNMNMGMGMGLGFNSGFLGQQQQPGFGMQDNGKGKAPAIDFDAAFDALSASLAESALAPAPAAHIEEEVAAAAVPADLDEFATYESELQQWMDAQREDGEYDYGVGLQQAWEHGLGATEPSATAFDDEGVPQLGPYQFEPNNPYLSAPLASGRSLLGEAKALLAAGGSLTTAARLLEAALQRAEPGAGGYEAWLLLGEARSMDEREDRAMQALAEGVRVAAENGAPGAGMLTLAISYTNESYDRGANALLLRWLRARYPAHPVPPETLASTAQSAWHSTPLVTDAFLALARAQAGAPEPDVQAALGALLYGRGEYGRAGECFAAALAARPGDARLWNRYGSCLSNGAAPEAALAAYREALRLRPAYTRAVYNVAVACLNIGAHKEAAEHLLDALAGQGPDASAQCWSTLARVFRVMGREDLAARAEGKPDVEVFRREGFDFRAAGDRTDAAAV